MKGLGIVFAGGGGKGAYEIGVWKYLHEIGLDNYIRAVSGTSVGALNAALFVGSNYKLAEKLWLNITQDKILTPKNITADDILKWLVINGFSISAPLTIGMSKIASGAIMGAGKLAQMTLTKIKGDYIFSRSGIKELIFDGLDFPTLQNSEIPCFVTCMKCNTLTVERFKLNEYSSEDITTLLLASSAIPIIFPNENFYGNDYCDGGIPIIGDNVPIKPVYDTGVENIIVVHLSQDSIIDKTQFPNSRIIEIVPRIDLGNALNGTLDFSSAGAAKRINLGYEDAKRVLKPMLEMIAMTVENQKMLAIAKEKNSIFESKRSELNEEMNKIKEKMKTDGFDDIFSQLTKETN